MKTMFTIFRVALVSLIFIIPCQLKSASSGLDSEFESLFDDKTEPGDVYGQFGIGLDMLIPRINYKRHNDNLGFGFGVNCGLYVPKTPILIGLDFSYIIFGSEDWSERMIESVYDDDLDVSSSYNLVSTGLFFKVQPYEGIVQPYLELFAGFNYIFATTEIKIDDVYWGEEDADVETDFNDIVGSFGFGGGVVIPLATDNLYKKGVFLDFNMKYLYGGEAEYLKKGSKYLYKDELIYDVTKSRTDSYSMRLGVSFRF